MKIKSDERLNEQLQEEVSTLRKCIAKSNKNYSGRFLATESETSPSMIVTDAESGKSIEVPLFAYGDVMKALKGLFE